MNLEPKHNQAICREIGARLRTDLSREQASMPHKLRQLLHRLEDADSQLFSPSGAADMPRDIRRGSASVARHRGHDRLRSIDVRRFMSRGSARRIRHVGRLEANAEANAKVEAAGVAKLAAKVRILPPDEIFLGLTIAGIVVLIEIGVILLLTD